MKLNPIALAIPVFFGAIALEWWLARRRRLQIFRFSDAVADLGCGIGNQAFALTFAALLLGVYGRVYEGWTLLRFEPGSPWPWVIAILGIDFLYYWWHRLSHEVNLLWAAHVVHHQSEDYNLAVALRQAYFTGFTILPFYLLLALVGVPAQVYAGAAALNLLYQFWIHTELVGRLPRPLEWVLNTPSHHRVHHGVNREYLDKNYGGILILWDRLFGSFEPERARVVYGVTVPLASFNPVWANFQYWVELGRAARSAPTLGRALRIFFAPPGWDPRTGEVKLPPPATAQGWVKYEVPTPPARIVSWIAVQFGLLSLGIIALLLFAEQLPWALIALASALIIAATLAWSALIEQRRWAWPLELSRLGASVALALFLLAG